MADPKVKAKRLARYKKRTSKAARTNAAYLLRDVGAVMKRAQARAKKEGGRNISDLLRFWLKVYGDGESIPLPSEAEQASFDAQDSGETAEA